MMMAVNDDDNNDDVDAHADLGREFHSPYLNLAKPGWRVCQGHYIALIQRPRTGHTCGQQASDPPKG